MWIQISQNASFAGKYQRRRIAESAPVGPDQTICALTLPICWRALFADRISRWQLNSFTAAVFLQKLQIENSENGRLPYLGRLHNPKRD
jgi:hypothetical protein